jgi:hypothetical protein
MKKNKVDFQNGANLRNQGHMNKIYCSCCGRQIVSYRTKDKHTIGPASDGCLSLGFGKYACPSCSIMELEFERLENENNRERKL